MVLVPKKALDWLFGEGPDEHGDGFGANKDEKTPPYWWHPGHGWTNDANRAVRFCRKEDADAYIENGKFIAGTVATEHKWVSMPIVSETTAA